MMWWIRVAVTFSLISLAQANKECFQHYDWKVLLEPIKHWSISHDCVKHFDKASLCDPELMLSQMEHKEIVLADILKKVETMYQKSQHSHQLKEHFAVVHYKISSCPTTQHVDSSASHEPVTTCFNKLENFLDNKKGHTQCAWEIVDDGVRQIFQRLYKHYISKARRRRRSLLHY